MHKYFLAISLLFSIEAQASAPGWMITGATVTGVTSTSNNQDAFWLWYEPADSVCNGKIKFQKSFSGTDDTFDRSFTLATTALASGLKASVYNYTDVTDCFAAVAIELKK